jgi:uncharacterized protein (TIGR02145 family)
MKRIFSFPAFQVFILGFLLAITNSCKTEINPKLLPLLTTSAITNITQNTATSGGTVISDNGLEVTACGICWSLKPNPTINDSITKDSRGMGVFTSSISRLIADTTYYVRAYATNSEGTAYGFQVTFKTLTSVFPVLTTTEATDITESTATSGGVITFNGGTAITAHGVCWSTSENPTVQNDKTSDGESNGTFTSKITNLITGTTYYLRAYATNKTGTGYGNQTTFRTQSIPTLTTTNVTSIGSTTTTSGGNIISDGGAAVTVRGVCWSTNANPTIADSKTSDGIGEATFISKITGLSSGTTYYVRAYATNASGTGYGETKSFSTLFAIVFNPNLTYGSVTDIDGNVYKTITIGTQTWMAENLRTSKYRNGESISNLAVYADWAAATFGAWCDYDNDATTYDSRYGKLYNWYAVNDSRNIAPTGWHVATDAEWTTLTNYVSANFGTSLCVAKALAATTDWTTSTSTYNIAGPIDSNLAINNYSGFCAFPGGSRNIYAAFLAVGVSGYWWSSSSYNTTNAWYRGLDHERSYVISNSYTKANGFSVRCVRD